MKQSVALIVLFAVLWSAICGCSSAKDRGTHWVSAVRQAHQSVDDPERDPVRAERQLRSAIEQAPDEPNDVERWVVQDLTFRLAQLLADTGSPERARAEIEAGLGISDSPTLARANLLALQGKLLQQQGETEAAAAAYHAALLINELLMDQALSGSSPESGRP